MTIAGNDRLDLYLVATTSHDGSAPLRVDATPVRVVCANTQRMALRQSRGHYSFRHTKGSRGKIYEARNALGMAWQYYEAFQEQAERMLNETLTLGEFKRLTARLWTADPGAGKRAHTNQILRESTLSWLFCDAETQENIRGTRWAAYQAVTEYIDHYAPAKHANIRANRVLTSPATTDIKHAAYQLLAV